MYSRGRSEANCATRRRSPGRPRLVDYRPAGSRRSKFTWVVTESPLVGCAGLLLRSQRRAGPEVHRELPHGLRRRPACGQCTPPRRREWWRSSPLSPSASSASSPPRSQSPATTPERSWPSDVPSHNVFDHPEKARGRVRLGEYRDGSPAVLGAKRVVRWGCGHEHDVRSEVWPTVFDPTIEVFTGHSGHVQVGQDDIVAAPSEQFECLSPAFCGVGVVAAPPQREVEEFPRVRVILNDQDAVSYGRPPSCNRVGSRPSEPTSFLVPVKSSYWTKVQ
jgi:hypothetical protein